MAFTCIVNHLNDCTHVEQFSCGLTASFQLSTSCSLDTQSVTIGEMLNHTERNCVLRYLRRFCTFAFLPLEINVKTWEIHAYVQAPWKRLICRFFFAIYCSHGICKVCSLLRVFMFLRDTPLYQIVIHIIIAASYTVTSFWYYLLHFKHPGINAAVVGMTLTGSAVGRK